MQQFPSYTFHQHWTLTPLLLRHRGAERSMNTPKGKTLAETQALISDFFARHCRLEYPRDLRCALCGGEIRRVRAFLSLHDERFGDSCVGPGRAWRMEIPYCSSCEKPPSQYGCIHMRDDELNLPSVLEASQPFGPEHPNYRKLAHP